VLMHAIIYFNACINVLIKTHHYIAQL